MDFARALWLRIETIHAVTYFDPASTEAGAAVGLDGFWMGYFGFRAAPLGTVGRAVVTATFANFAPDFVARWVPEVWNRATPATLLAARRDAAAVALGRRSADHVQAAAAAIPVLREAVLAAPTTGRPLFAANREVPVDGDPVAELWQLCTSLREHRGDGHVAALTGAGLDGLDAHVLIAFEHGHPAEDLQRTRGWSPDQWEAAVDRLTRRGLVAAGVLGPAGRALRAEIEAITDELAAAPFAALDDADRTRLLAELAPLAREIAESGVIRFPNPMSLPSIADAEPG